MGKDGLALSKRLNIEEIKANDVSGAKTITLTTNDCGKTFIIGDMQDDIICQLPALNTAQSGWYIDIYSSVNAVSTTGGGAVTLRTGATCMITSSGQELMMGGVDIIDAPYGWPAATASNTGYHASVTADFTEDFEGFMFISGSGCCDGGDIAKNGQGLAGSHVRFLAGGTNLLTASCWIVAGTQHCSSSNSDPGAADKMLPQNPFQT